MAGHRDGWEETGHPYMARVRLIFCNTSSHFSRGSAANEEGLSRSWFSGFVEGRVPPQTQGPAPVRHLQYEALVVRRNLTGIADKMSAIVDYRE